VSSKNISNCKQHATIPNLVTQCIDSGAMLALLKNGSKPATYLPSTESSQQDNVSIENKLIQYYILGASILACSHEFLLQSVCYCDNDDLLVERIGILTNITRDGMPPGLHWYDLLLDYSCKIIRLGSDETNCMDGRLWASKDYSHWFTSSNMIEAVHNELLQYVALVNGSQEMMLHLLFVWWDRISSHWW